MKFSIKLSQIAQFVGGEITGEDVTITQFAMSPDKATKDDLVFLYDPKYIKRINEFQSKAMILPKSEKGKVEVSSPVLWVERPRLVLKTLLTFIQKPKYKPQAGVDKTAVVDPSAQLGKNCAIGPYVSIGPNAVIGDNVTIKSHTFISHNVQIGNNCEINPNCTILDNTIIKNNVIINSGCVIGGDGFGYVTEDESNLEKIRKGQSPNLNIERFIQHKIPTTGNVVIEDDVEIGSNTTIDAGTIASTVIGAGTKIDNLVLVAHNVKIGKDCLIVGGTAIGGSTVLGDRVVVGGHCSFADNMEVGNDAVFVARSAVHGRVPSNSVYIGVPAVPYMDFMRNEKNLKRLPLKIQSAEEKIKLLEEKIKLLEEKLLEKV